MSEKADSFSRALSTLIARREGEFSKAFSAHLTAISLANRTASGADAHGRLSIARTAYADTVNEAMESALRFGQTEGIAVRQLLELARPPLTDLANRIADVARFPVGARAQETPDIPAMITLGRLNKEFADLLDNAAKDAQAGRVGFARLSPMPFHRAALNAVRTNPWLALSIFLNVVLGAAIAYLGRK